MEGVGIGGTLWPAMSEEHFWRNRRVFITGHTGFKGTWLSLWLHSLGATVTGYALPPPTTPSLFELCATRGLVHSLISDVRDRESLGRAVKAARPEIVIHMAGQSLVRESYRNPVDTYEINVMGTVNVLEAVKSARGVRAVVIVTSDKCYENTERLQGYREDEPMGGYDPYSCSKGCAELVASSYRSSFFNSERYASHGVGVASARAGNAIGGGDWAVDRLVPDCVRALLKGEKIRIRKPRAVRPWQYVLDPINGYLMLAQRLCGEGTAYGSAWNFGPDDRDARTVEWVAKRMCERWGEKAAYEIDTGLHPHEADYLKLDCAKAKAGLGWRPRWGAEEAIDRVIQWARAYKDGGDLREACLKQISEFSSAQGQKEKDDARNTVRWTVDNE
jgi:CDP-glucose 4,6-dehydratase